MLRQVLHAGLRTSFHALGRFVASHPVFFASAPVLLSILLGASFSRYRVEDDVESLLAPKHSLAKIEGNLVDSLFPVNRSKHALYSDLQTPGRYGRVIVTTRKGSVLDPVHLDTILKLHRRIYQMQVTVPATGFNSFNYSFSYLCLPDDKNVCIIDDIIRAMEEIQSARTSNRSIPTLRYPITQLADGRQAYIGHQLGGVQGWGPSGAFGVTPLAVLIMLQACMRNRDYKSFNSILIFSHGLFGSFEMLSSWRRTREDQHVKERVASVFEDVMLRFSGSTMLHLMTLGLAASPLTNMEAVRLFCRTAALAVTISYVYMLSFYSSCLVFTGYLETGYRHGCFCRRVPKPDRLDSKPAWYRCLMYTRYQDETQTTNPPHAVTQGSDPSALVAMDTATVLYTRAQQRYFSSYSPVIGFYIYESAPYWNASVQRDLLEYAKGFQRISWLEAYLNYLSDRNQSTSQPRENFTRTLRHSFLREPQFAHFADDIIFAERGQGEEPDVAASRIFLVAKTTENKREEMSVLLDTLRRLSLTSRVRFLIFNPSFVYLDRYAAAVSSPLRHSLLAVLFLLGLSSLAVVEPLVSVWLGLTLLSVQFGVLGFMTLWGVELDCMSVLCLISALGHSADCSGPLLCGFASGRGDSRTRWVRVALERHGVPSLQTLICYSAALVPVGSVRSNLTRTLFRCLTLTAGCSALHTLAFLPTLLTFLPPSKSRGRPEGEGQRQEVECVEMNDSTRVVDQITTV
ncbi:Patched domain-containing protein 1 [Larimichthys crocea]|uniref:Uncharacterized protein n=1 Tax=Larimichthys crocea TaxID=215358 RepID=A0ACD3QPE4_LARCR|nr:Patched domain-containing protein 1 [Larimichthys crocea]